MDESKAKKVEFLLSATPREILAQAFPAGKPQFRTPTKGFKKRHPKRGVENRWARRHRALSTVEVGE